MTRFLHGQGGTRDYGTRAGRQSLPAGSSLHGLPKKNGQAKKTLDGHRRFAYVGGCRALVAQLDRATGYEPVGREFESLRAHHTMTVGRLAAKGRPFSSEKAKKCLTFFRSATNVHFHQALVAQLDRATGYEPVGREFESLRAHHSRAKAYEISHKPFFLCFFSRSGSFPLQSFFPAGFPGEAVFLPLPPQKKRTDGAPQRRMPSARHVRFRESCRSYAACEAPFSLRN